MSDLSQFLQHAVLALAGLGVIALLPTLGRAWLGRQRATVLTQATEWRTHAPTGLECERPRVLFFSGSWCVECHTRQKPALERLHELVPGVAIEEVDAGTNPDLLRRYRVGILPTTVVLDGAGSAREINYGFADEGRLAGQLAPLVGAA